MNTEGLMTCPLCKRSGFSAKGIKVHFCDALPRERGGQRVRLPQTLVAAILDGRITTASKLHLLERGTASLRNQKGN